MTFDELADIEPGLKALFEEAKAVKDHGETRYFCANDVWYSSFKPRLVMLVGWEANTQDQRLHTSEAYDIAYDAIYDQLPECRNCTCL